MRQVLTKPELNGTAMTYRCYCVAGWHTLMVDREEPGRNWEYNGDPYCPTFHPSVLARGDLRGPFVCHSFVRVGMIEFLPDCTHEFAGQTLPMLPIEEPPCAPTSPP